MTPPLPTGREEREAVVAFMRLAACNAIAGDVRPAFVVKTPDKAHAVLAFAMAKLAKHIAAGDHLQKDQDHA